ESCEGGRPQEDSWKCTAHSKHHPLTRTSFLDSSDSGGRRRLPIATPQVASFDVFLCSHRPQQHLVARIAGQLRRNDIAPWFDQEQLRPGLPWQRVLES